MAGKERFQEVVGDEAVFDPEGTDTSDSKEGEMLWCLHCERCYPYGWYRPVRDGGATLHMCPYEGCDGDVFMDAWPWEKLVRMNGYPEDPEFGKRYPMYS